jgi:hypothetical protein
LAGDRVDVVAPGEAWREEAPDLQRRAEVALDAAAAFWDARPPHVTVVVRGADDLYNAWVDPLGGPVVSLPPIGAWPPEVGAGAPDPEMLLLVHEMIHAVHFGGRPGSLPVPTGIVGASVPWPPPAWLLEGVAVWAESRLVPGEGGRLDDPDARSVLRVLAASGDWPALSDAALITHAAWPGGRLRYLAGGALVERMVDEHGLATLRRAIRRYETQPPWRGFAHAWRVETGTDLAATWASLGADLAEETDALADRVGARVATGRGPARSQDGRRLAWREGATVHVAPWPEEGTATPSLSVRVPSAPGRLAWTAEGELLYARLETVPEGRRREVFRLDPATGRETRLTRGAYARAPAPEAGGCVLFVRDRAPVPGELRTWCPGGPAAGRTLWTPPDGARLVGLATSPGGRVAVVVDRDGRRTLAEVVRGDGDPRLAALPGPPTGSVLALRDPVWHGETVLWVVGRLDGPDGTDWARTASWRIDFAPGARGGDTVVMAAPRGGVVDHAPGLIAARRAGGPVLVRPADAPSGERAHVRAEDRPPSARSGSDATRGFEPGLDDRGHDATGRGAFRPYDPRAQLRILGWLPVASGGAVGVRASAVDPARRLGVDATVGVVPGAEGPLGPVWLGVALRVGDAGPVATPAPPPPATARLRVGVLPVAPHRSAPLGPRPRLDASAEAIVAGEPRVRLGGAASVQLLEGRPRLAARLRLSAADGVADSWGVPRRAWAAAATWRSDPLPDGRTSGAWLDAALWRPLNSDPALTLRTDVRAGWRPPPPAPAPAWGDAVLAGRAEVAWTVPVRARVADGRWAFERLRFAPAVRLGATRDDAGAWGAAAGLEATLASDVVLGYGAAATVAVQAGWAWDGTGRPGGWLRLAAPGLP